MIRRPPRSTQSRSSAASDVYKRQFASSPSERSGWRRYRASVTITPSTESPRNSRRSFVGIPPASWAKERWVSASTRSSGSSWTPSFSVSLSTAVIGTVRPESRRAANVSVPGARCAAPRRTGGRCRRRKPGTRCAGASPPCSAGMGRGSPQSSSIATDAHGCCCATSCASEQPRLALFRLVQHACQRRPPGVDDVVCVARVVRQPRSALGAQTWAVGLADRLERQCRYHRVPERGLEVDQIADKLAHLVLIVALDLSRSDALGVGEQLLDIDLDLLVDHIQAPYTLPRRPTANGSGDQDPLHHGLEPQLEIEIATGGDADDVRSEVLRSGNRALHGPHRTRTATQLVRVEHER